MLWGQCIYSDQHAFIAILSIDKELFLYSTTRIQLRRHECTIRHWFGTVGWFVQLLCGTFHQESDYPTFFCSEHFNIFEQGVHTSILAFEHCKKIKFGIVCSSDTHTQIVNNVKLE